MNSSPAASPARQTVRKLKKGFENRLNDSTSPKGVRNNNKNDLVFSHTLVGCNALTHPANLKALEKTFSFASLKKRYGTINKY